MMKTKFENKLELIALLVFSECSLRALIAL